MTLILHWHGIVTGALPLCIEAVGNCLSASERVSKTLLLPNKLEGKQ